MNGSISESQGLSSGSSDYPYAPGGWQVADAERVAEEEGLTMGADLMELVSALQEYYAKHESNEFRIRELIDALEEHFHHKGGMKYLYRLTPGGPVAQGCRLAGLKAPAGSEDKSFGSVQ